MHPDELRHASERSLLAWLRTATALFALAAGVAQLGSYFEVHAHAGRTGAFGGALVIGIAALATVLLGVDDYRRRTLALDDTTADPAEAARSHAPYALAIVVGLAGLSLLVLACALA